MHILMWYLLIGLVYSIIGIGLSEFYRYKLTKEHSEEWKLTCDVFGKFGIIFILGINMILWPASVGYVICVIIKSFLKFKSMK